MNWLICVFLLLVAICVKKEIWIKFLLITIILCLWIVLIVTPAPHLIITKTPNYYDIQLSKNPGVNFDYGVYKSNDTIVKNRNKYQ